MELITNRTHTDVLLGNEKGFYGVADMNRVESAVLELAEMLRVAGSSYTPVVKTNWSEGEMPGPDDLARYLGNVAELCRLSGVNAALPDSMDRLNWEGANQIEAALMAVSEKLSH